MSRDRLRNLAFGAAIVWSIVAGGLAWQKAGENPDALVRSVSGWQSLGRSSHAFGPAEARVTLVVFSDFQCPFCRRFAAVVDTIRSRYPDIRIVERNFPLASIHPHARFSATAAECASAVGRYEQMRNLLFSDTANVREENWAALAREAGITDTRTYSACLASREVAATIQADVSAGEQLGLSGTPAVLVNDSLFLPPPADIMNRLKHARERR